MTDLIVWEKRHKVMTEWSELPFPSPGDLPNPGMEPRSPALQADSSPDEPPGKPPQLMIKKAISPGEKLAKL